MTARNILAHIVFVAGLILVLAGSGLGLLYGALTDPRPVK